VERLYNSCIGCPVVKEGEKCNRLTVFLKEINFDDPGFVRSEINCDGIPGSCQKAVVTRDQAICVNNCVADFVLRVFGFY
jgi:hypothetical protein